MKPSPELKLVSLTADMLMIHPLFQMTAQAVINSLYHGQYEDKRIHFDLYNYVDAWIRQEIT